MRRPPPVGGEKVTERDKSEKRSSDDVSEKGHRCKRIEKEKKTSLSLSSPPSSTSSSRAIHSPSASLKTRPGTSATRSCAGREGALSWFPSREEKSERKKRWKKDPFLSLATLSSYSRDSLATVSTRLGGHRGAVDMRRKRYREGPRRDGKREREKTRTRTRRAKETRKMVAECERHPLFFDGGRKKIQSSHLLCLSLVYPRAHRCLSFARISRSSASLSSRSPQVWRKSKPDSLREKDSRKRARRHRLKKRKWFRRPRPREARPPTRSAPSAACCSPSA